MLGQGIASRIKNKERLLPLTALSIDAMLRQYGYRMLRPVQRKQEAQTIFTKNDVELLKAWSYRDQWEERTTKAPLLRQVMERLVNVEKVKKEEGIERKRRGVLFGVGVLLQTRNQYTNATGTLTGLILRRGGASEKTFRRLNDR